MKIKNGTGLLIIMTCMVGLASCGEKKAGYADGTYEGKSSVYGEQGSADYGNGYGVADITISGGIITECTFLTYEPDGTLKAESYGMEGGKISNRDFYNRAQKAVAACGVYAEQLVKDGSVKDVDAISGATINYDLFKSAVEDALNQASSK